MSILHMHHFLLLLFQLYIQSRESGARVHVGKLLLSILFMLQSLSLNLRVSSKKHIETFFMKCSQLFSWDVDILVSVC